MDSSSTTKRLRLDPEERRAQLLECAVKAYALSGVGRAGHGDVAKLAGVSTGTVFNYFPTREALTDAVLEFIRGHFRTLLSSLPDSVITASDYVRYMATAYDGLTEAHPDITKVLLNWSVTFSPAIRPQFLAFQNEILVTITDSLPGVKADQFGVRMILASSNMLGQMKLDNTDPETIQKFVDRVADAIG
ncbi:MAG: TetR/AcrR family transcriptional regulator [Alphaproteobacteria bacterium]